MAEAEAVAAALRDCRFCYADEHELAEGVAQVLASAFDGSVEHEVRLNARDRVDLLLDGVGVEVKVAGSASALARQLARYAQSPRVASLVVVTTRARHVAVPAVIGGKPVHVVSVAQPC